MWRAIFRKVGNKKRKIKGKEKRRKEKVRRENGGNKGNEKREWRRFLLASALYDTRIDTNAISYIPGNRCRRSSVKPPRLCGGGGVVGYSAEPTG